MAWDPEMEVVFHPKSVAVVGASGRTIDNLRQGAQGGTGFIHIFKRLGFEGNIYPINPNATEILGLKAYPSIAELPEPVDLVIVSVPGKQVPGALEECARAGVKNIHVFTSGFSEMGTDEGRKLEAQVLEVARREGLRIIGPNGMGLHVPAAKISTWDWLPAKSGPVAFLSQSGGHCVFYTRYARQFDIRFSKVISFGNAAMLDSTDFLEYFATDPETKVISMYLEGVKNGAKLVRQVKEIGRNKPVVIWKGGITESGSRAAASHTGSLAGNRALWDAFFAQSGAIAVGSVDDLADVTMTLLHLPPPRGRRVAVMGGGGGNSVAAADFCTQEGLEVPLLTEETRAELRSFVPPAGTSVRNPLDAPVILRDMSLFERTINIVAADPLIDIIIFNQQLDMLHEAGGVKQIQALGDLVCKFASENKYGQPMVAILHTWGGETEVRRERTRLTEELARSGIPVYRSLPRASRAIAKYCQYLEFKREAYE